VQSAPESDWHFTLACVVVTAELNLSKQPDPEGAAQFWIDATQCGALEYAGNVTVHVPAEIFPIETPDSLVDVTADPLSQLKNPRNILSPF